jgi:hypothetical protein
VSAAHDEARRFVEQLRMQNRAALGLPPTTAHPGQDAVNDELFNRFLRESLIPEDARNPEIRRLWEQARARDREEAGTEMFGQMHENIERIAVRSITRADGGPIDFTSLRPFVAELQTGQLNAVSMRVPGRHGAYLVLFETEMKLFASKISKAIAWAIPCYPHPAQEHMIAFEWGTGPIAERIKADPEITVRFADIVISYAATGSVAEAAHHLMPPGYLTLASNLRDSLEYFVLGHEYGHILCGHLDTAATRKGVLPAEEAEVLAYSWHMEMQADWLGMALAIHALMNYENQDFDLTFAGISLFFDAMDIMDRAVALLETGDEDARQLGSHPPSDVRRKYLADSLPQVVGNDPSDAETVTRALHMAESQSEIVRLLWERTRPILLDLRRQGLSAAHTWRTVPKEGGARSW